MSNSKKRKWKRIVSAALKQEQTQKTGFEDFPEDIPIERGVAYFYDPIKHKWGSSNVLLQIECNPFAQGMV